MSRRKEPSSISVLLHIPVFRRLWAAITISSLGDWLGLLATTSLAAYLTKNSSGLAQGAAISGVLLTRLLPDLVLAPIAGALVDRIDRRVIAAVGDTLASLLYLSIAVAGNLTWLLVAQFLVEAIGLFTNPAKQAMWVNVVPRERLAVANQLNYVSIYGMVPVAAALFALLSTAAQFFGAGAVSGSGSGLIGGPTSAVASNIALVLDAVTYLICAATVTFSRRLIPAFVGERSATKSVFSLIGEGISFVKNSRVMRALYIGVLGAFGAGGLTAGVAQSYVFALGAGTAGYGILFGAVFTGLAFGMLTGPKILPTVPRRMIFTSAVGGAGLTLLVMSTIPDFVGVAIAAAVMGWSAGIAWITGITMIGLEVADHLRGRVFAFVMSSVRLTLLATIAVGPVLAGVLKPLQVHIGSFRWTVSSPAIVLAVGGLIALLVAIYAGRQVGGLASSLLQRLFRRQRADWLGGRLREYPGVLIAIEGASASAAADLADRVTDQLRGEGWQVVLAVAPVESPPDDVEIVAADALQSMAALAQRVSGTVWPALAQGAVVVCSGYADAEVARFGAVAGLGEEEVQRTAAWAVDGLWPDLTLLVEVPEPRPVAIDPGLSTSDPASTTDPTPMTLAQAFRDRQSAAPERYLTVGVDGLPADGLSVELIQRLDSTLRSRTPGRAQPAESELPPAGLAPVAATSG